MNVTIYLPEELNERARAAGLKGQLSGLLQNAIEVELQRREAMTELTDDESTKTFKLNLVDKDGRSYIGNLTGQRIANTDDCDVYVASDERIIVHDLHKDDITECSAEDLSNWLQGSDYIEAMHALGETPHVEI